MLRRMGIAEFLACLMACIEERTGVACSGNPESEPSPFYYPQILKTAPADTKTSFVTRYELWIHCIAGAVVPHSDAPALELVQMVEEALTDDIDVPDGCQMIAQKIDGLQSIKKDESGEGHAVVGCTFDVLYGFKCK